MKRYRRLDICRDADNEVVSNALHRTYTRGQESFTLHQDESDGGRRSMGPTFQTI